VNLAELGVILIEAGPPDPYTRTDKASPIQRRLCKASVFALTKGRFKRRLLYYGGINTQIPESPDLKWSRLGTNGFLAVPQKHPAPG
jgi:hypothetical protein